MHWKRGRNTVRLGIQDRPFLFSILVNPLRQMPVRTEGISIDGVWVTILDYAREPSLLFKVRPAG